MAEEDFRILELSIQGFRCSQILAILALEAQQKDDPMLVRAMAGLLNGFGCGKTCGTLTGACCMLGLHAGRGRVDEEENDDLPVMLGDLVDWFEAEYGKRHGGINCDDITEKDAALRLSRCPQIITETFRKACAILADHGYSLDGQPLVETE
jgi:hypothetical protein